MLWVETMFSVVIPLYNKAYGIEKALQSILNQEGNFIYEIIIVNDGSTDGSEHIAEKFVSDNIKLLHQKNSGVSVARNKAIRHSKYDVICFLDADDWWESNYFATLMHLVINFPKESFFLMGFQKVNKTEIKVIEISKKLKVFKKFGSNFFYTRGLVTPSIAIKKKALFDAGLFPEGITISEDLFLWSKILDKYSVVYTPKIVSNIYYEEDSSRANRELKTPYVLEYYANNSLSLKNLKGFLLYIYIAHLYQSIKIGDFESWKRRWIVGRYIFPIIYYISFFSVVFILKKIIWNKDVFK